MYITGLGLFKRLPAQLATNYYVSQVVRLEHDTISLPTTSIAIRPPVSTQAARLLQARLSTLDPIHSAYTAMTAQ